MDTKRFKRLRKLADHTQKSLADKMGVSVSTIAMWERGERDPDTDMLVRICDELDCTADYLIGRTKHRHGMILEKDSLPEQLKGIDVKLEVVKTINESGLSEKQIKHALWLYKQYEKYHNDDRE